MLRASHHPTTLPLVWLLMALAGVAPCTAIAQPPPPPSGAAGLADTARVRRWTEEVLFITDRIRATHPRPFHRFPEGAFDSAASAIVARIPTTEDSRLAIECMRMVSALEDGHTQLIGILPQLGFTAVLPVLLRPFQDGLYVTGAAPEHASLVGSRVVGIGKVSADEVLARVATITGGDNRSTQLDRSPLFLMSAGALHALDISPDRTSLTLEIERAPNRTERVTVRGGPPPAGFPQAFLATEPRLPDGWAGARRLPAAGPPRCDRRPEEAWWFEDLPQARALYLRLRRVDPIAGGRGTPENHRRFYQRLFAHADSVRPDALIADLRHNHGGNNAVVDPLIRGLAARPWLNREGGLFVLIDRGTFSAAMNAAVFLEDRTEAVFVGEPTGGGLNHYGDAAETGTPHFGMMLQVSTIPWLSRWPMDPRRWIAPDIAVPSTYADWREGRDPVLDAALDAARNGTRDQRVLAASRRGGPEAGAAAFREWDRAHPNPWGSGVLNDLALSISAMLDRGRWDDAVALGEVLLRLEPESAPSWRFAGEAHLNAGDRARAVQCLREALRLDPQAWFSRRLLRELGEEP